MATFPYPDSICGNGILEGEEECDDGNNENGDGCTGYCTLEENATCGDGELNPGEECDDGNNENGDGCNAICEIERPETCGDGVIDPGEECDGDDLGAATCANQGNYVGGILECTIYCTLDFSGCWTDSCNENGLCEPIEGENADNCPQDCSEATCGNGVVEEGEGCDPAGETSQCDVDCTVAECGDGYVNTAAGEECDDGNTIDGDGCSSSCAWVTCGNGSLDPGEECDTAGDSATCDEDCTFPVCGDGHRNSAAGEECDDGNDHGGDGCTGLCKNEQTITLSQAGGVSLVDLPSTQAEWIVRITYNEGDDVFYGCGHAGGFYDPNHTFLAKFDSNGGLLWHQIGNESLDGYTYQSCSVEKGGNVYLVFVDTAKDLHVQKWNPSGSNLLWEDEQNYGEMEVFSKSTAPDGAGGLWIGGAVGTGSSQRVQLIHMDGGGSTVWTGQWGSEKCIATSLTPDGQGGVWVGGLLGSIPRDVFLIHVNANGTVVGDTEYGAGIGDDLIVRSLLTVGGDLYAGASKFGSNGYYISRVLRFDISTPTSPQWISEWVPPYILGTYEDGDGVLRSGGYVPTLAHVDGNIIAGYSDWEGWRNRALAVMGPDGTTSWSLIDGAAGDSNHEVIVGVYKDPTESYFLSVGWDWVAYSDHPVIAVIRWNIQ
jgi:cysteine-rich repeat protein